MAKDRERYEGCACQGAQDAPASVLTIQQLRCRLSGSHVVLRPLTSVLESSPDLCVIHTNALGQDGTPE